MEQTNYEAWDCQSGAEFSKWPPAPKSVEDLDVRGAKEVGIVVVLFMVVRYRNVSGARKVQKKKK